MTAPERICASLATVHQCQGKWECVPFEIAPDSPQYILATPEALASSPEVAAMIAEARREDAKLLLDAYKGVLVLMRMLDKAGLVAGASAADQISKRIVDAHPEFPGMASLRALKETTHD